MTEHPLPTVLLLNPPSGQIAIRDNYCSKISQAAYINHPIDLVIQSGFLSQHFQVHLIDAVVEKLDSERCLDRIGSIAPAGVFVLAGNATWNEDLAFLTEMKRRNPDCSLIVSGDVFLEDPGGCLHAIPAIDAISLDYTSPEIDWFLRGKRGSFKTLIHRDENGEIPDFEMHREHHGQFSIPCPDHALFKNRDYRYPFVKSRHFATVITEFGCPFHCAFCVMGTLGCKRRPVDEVIDELKYLDNLGIRDIFFLDQSFGSNPARNMDLCHAIQSTLPNLRWVCFSRVDLMTETILRTMKQAGCHTIIFGVETANPALLKQYRKGYSLEQVTRIFALARALRIRTVATFLLGLPGETRESAEETIEFARKLPVNFASLNVAVPRMGTDLRHWAVEKGYVDGADRHFDQSGSQVVMRTESLSAEELSELKQRAVRRLYLNPASLIKILCSIRSWDEFVIQIREGLYLFTRYMRRKS